MDEKAFLKQVAERLLCDEKRAEGVTFAVFLELRDRLTPQEAAHVAAQLPNPLKSLWNSLDRPNRQVRRVGELQFIGEVRKIAGLPDEIEAELAVKAVFGVLQKLLGAPTGMEGEAWDIYSQLPKDLKHLWLQSAEGYRTESNRA